MTAVEQNLLAALRELEHAAVRTHDATPNPDLQRLFTRIDELTVSLPDDSSDALRHYLHRRSYEKARRFLEGREAENEPGSCRH